MYAESIPYKFYIHETASFHVEMNMVETTKNTEKFGCTDTYTNIEFVSYINEDYRHREWIKLKKESFNLRAVVLESISNIDDSEANYLYDSQESRDNSFEQEDSVVTYAEYT